MTTTKKKTAKKATRKPVAKKKKRAPAKPIINLMDVSAIEPKDYLRVTAINPDSEHMTEAYGISEERFVELDIIAMTAVKRTEKFSAAVEIVSQHCKHANELAMCVFLLAEERHKMPPFLQMLMQMKKRRDEDPGQP